MVKSTERCSCSGISAEKLALKYHSFSKKMSNQKFLLIKLHKRKLKKLKNLIELKKVEILEIGYQYHFDVKKGN